MYRRAWMAGLAFALLAGTADAQTARTHLNFAIAAQDFGRLDPHYSTTTPDKAVVGWMFSGLVRFRPGSIDPNQIEPDIAERWETSPDGKTWTFHLRRGVQFHHNFGELTAEDVVFSLQKAADRERSGFSSDFAAFERIEAVDPYTVRITLRNVVPNLLLLVTNYHGGNIMSRRAVQQYGEEVTRRPVGTGPFQLAEIRPRQSLELVRHDAYFRGRPALERVSYRYIPSNAARDLAFQSGELDVTHGVSEQQWVERMRAVRGVVVEVTEPAELAHIHVNVTRPPFNDIRVRQALAHAINRDEMVRFTGAAITRAARSPVPIGYQGQVDVPLPEHSVDRARALLREAGHPNGITFRVIHTQLPGMLGPMQVVQAQLRRAGFNMELDVVEHATFHAQIRQNLSPLVYYAAARAPIADVYLSQFYHSRAIVQTPTAVTNFNHCNVADAEIDAARVEVNRERQNQLWAEAQRKLMANLCVIPLHESLSVFARRENVEWGYELRGSLTLGPLITERTRIR